MAKESRSTKNTWSGSEPGDNGLTWRSVGLGLFLVVLISLGPPYSIWMAGSSEITWSHFPVGVGVPFLIIVFFNALVRRLFHNWALRPAELVIILVMGLIATTIPIFIIGTLLGIISAPYYAATMENEWADYIQPYLPEWAIPAGEGEAMRWFFEGLPTGHDMPLDVWIGPLIWWLSLMLAIYFVCFCLVVLLRRQWVEHERLIFPLTEMPRLLIAEGGTTLLHARMFWIGCSVPVPVSLVALAPDWIGAGFPVDDPTDRGLGVFGLGGQKSGFAPGGNRGLSHGPTFLHWPHSRVLSWGWSFLWDGSNLVLWQGTSDSQWLDPTRLAPIL